MIRMLLNASRLLPWRSSSTTIVVLASRLVKTTASRPPRVLSMRMVSAYDSALGRYQLMGPALIDAGMKDKAKRWTGRHGIFSENDFLGDPVAQDQAMQDYFDRLEGQLTDKGAWDKIGQEIRGVKATFQITPQGLLAAAHRQGAGAVRQYLDHLVQRGWVSDVDALGADPWAEAYRAIETRLRLFEGTPYRP